jgi:radical SAM-linked protein
MKEQRIRITFSKTEAMRFTGHLDLRKTWERTFRRSGLPLAYSQGYTPHPQLNMASPLPLGFTSTAEIGDFWLSEIVPLPDIREKLSEAVPPGLELHNLEEIPDLHGDKLPVLTTASTYVLTVYQGGDGLQDQVDALNDRDQIIRERRGKAYDLTELLHSLEMLPPDQEGHPRLKMTLSTLPGATGRPDEVADQLGLPEHRVHIVRTKIHLRESN